MCVSFKLSDMGVVVYMYVFRSLCVCTYLLTYLLTYFIMTGVWCLWYCLHVSSLLTGDIVCVCVCVSFNLNVTVSDSFIP